jgi:hypothetical protein
MDYTNPVTYTVTAEDSTTEDYEVTVNVAPGITINTITNPSLSKLTFTGGLTSLSTVTVTPSTSITISLTNAASVSVTASAWRIDISGRKDDIPHSTTYTFTAPATRGFYNVNVLATVDGIDYSGSFGLIVK